MTMHRRGLMIEIFGLLMMAAGSGVQAGEPDRPLVEVNVVDEAGQPVAGAEACLIDIAYGLPITRVWTAAHEGAISIPADNISRFFEGEEVAGDARLIVRAPGLAWGVASVSLPADAPVTVTLNPGRAITLKLAPGAGRTLPDDLEPVVYTAQLGTAVWMTCVQGYETRQETPGTAVVPAPPMKAGRGAYVVHVPRDVESFSVLVDHPGFLRAFESHVITMADLDNGSVAIELPRPAAITVNIGPLDDAPAAYSACGVDAMHSPTVPDGWIFHVERRFGAGRSFATVFDDLAPGGYSFDGFTGDSETWNKKDREDYCETRGWAEAAAGEAKTVEMHLETYDEAHWQEKLRGDYDLTISVNQSTGRPAEGKPYELAWSLRQFGKQVPLASGKVPEDGLIHLDGLSGTALVPIVLTVGGEYIDQFVVRGEDHHQAREYPLAPAVGDEAPDFEMTTLANGDVISLGDFRGRVVLLEFWASWCGPCQEPMKHNNELMSRRGDSWRDKVAIIGVSIDDEIDTIRKHVDERDWNAVRQAWVPGAWKADAVKMYAVTAVPSAFLIDRDGTIVWAGHPASIDVEAKVEELLKGE